VKIPLTGCDGLPKTGQAWVRNGLLAATIYIRPNADLALEMLTKAIQSGVQPPEHTMTEPQSMPSLDAIVARTAKSGDEKLQLSVGV